MFGGREVDIRDCAGLLTDESTKVLLLHGWTGCGKSSFLRAGLIPYLESRVPIFQFMPDFDIDKTKALFIRCTEEPLLRLCETLYDWSEEPFSIEVGRTSRRCASTCRRSAGQRRIARPSRRSTAPR